MMNRRQAAQYFIVAWVKDWPLRTYLHVLADGGPPILFDQAQALYPWLPDRWAFLKRQYCRSYLAESNRPLSDALWDAADDRARLALAAQVEAFVFQRQWRGYAAEAQKALHLAKLRLGRGDTDTEASIETMRRGSGHHWKVCK